MTIASVITAPRALHETFIVKYWVSKSRQGGYEQTLTVNRILSARNAAIMMTGHSTWPIAKPGGASLVRIVTIKPGQKPL